LLVGNKTKRRRTLLDFTLPMCVSQMSVIPFDHSGIDVPQIFGNDEQWCTGHDAQAGVRMSQRVNRDPRNLGALNGSSHRANLIALRPSRTIRLAQHEFSTVTPSR